MTFFESLVALLAAAIVLLQVSRRLALPYPAMLAAAGVGLGLIPGAPKITLDPQTALALFIAPVLVDAAFDFPPGAVWRLWRPLVALAVVAVGLSALAVAWLGMTLVGMPLFAALALGAIVAPPDAAAATAVLGAVSMPRRTVAVLKGESLLNDASALLLYSAATTVPQHGGLDAALALKIGIAAPGAILLGFVLARLFRYVTPIVTGTLGGNLMEFVTAFGVWLIAEHLGLSPVLCLVAFAMTIARSAALGTPPRMRIHSFAVWDSATFLLNVLAFLLMGFQARTIVGGMSLERLKETGAFVFAVVVCLIVVRMAWVLVYNRLAKRFKAVRGDFKPASLRHGVLVGWCGMRGLVTLATAFALPANFPQRDVIVLTAFAVVLTTLVLQGLTLAPLVRLLKLDGEDGLDGELARARAEMAGAALNSVGDQTGPAADHWRYAFAAAKAAASTPPDTAALKAKRKIGRVALREERQTLERLRSEGRVGADAYLILQEELDFSDVSLASENERHIQES